MPEKFRITVIDFMPLHKKVEVGKYADGTPACLGDCVKYNNQENWLIAYRYGQIMLKQIGNMGMIIQPQFKDGDFSKVDPTNIFLAGEDYLIVGMDNEPMFEKINSLQK